MSVTGTGSNTSDGTTRRVKNARHILIYAIDLSIPPQAGAENNEWVEFRWIGGLIWHILTNKTCQDAIIAGRFRMIKIRPNKPRPQPDTEDEPTTDVA